MMRLFRLPTKKVVAWDCGVFTNYSRAETFGTGELSDVLTRSAAAVGPIGRSFFWQGNSHHKDSQTTALHPIN